MVVVGGTLVGVAETVDKAVGRIGQLAVGTVIGKVICFVIAPN